MTHKSTLIQLKSTEEVIMEIDDLIVPAFKGERIMMNSFWYKIKEVNLYTKKLSTSVAIYETLWVEPMEE